MFYSSTCRYIYIIKPLHYRQMMTPSRAIGILILVWIYSIVMGFLPMMGWRVETSTCDRGETYPPMYVLLIFISGCVLPILVTGFLFMRVIQEARRHSKKIIELEMSLITVQTKTGTIQHQLCADTSQLPQAPSTPQTPQATANSEIIVKSRKKHKKGQHNFLTIVLLMVYFEISWLPVFSSMLLDAFVNPRILPSWAHSLFGLMAFANSALDPVVYGYRNRRIKHACMQMCITWTRSLLERLGCKCADKIHTDLPSKYDSST